MSGEPDNNTPEIAITPEMIRAGVNFADAQLDGLASISDPSLVDLVRGVIEAALREGQVAFSLTTAAAVALAARQSTERGA